MLWLSKGALFSVIDTSVIVYLVKNRDPIYANVSIFSVIEYPAILQYDWFRGEVLHPLKGDLDTALELRKKLMHMGRMKGTVDLIIAAMCINRNDRLITSDSDFQDIAVVSGLILE